MMSQFQTMRFHWVRWTIVEIAHAGVVEIGDACGSSGGHGAILVDEVFSLRT